MAHLHRVLVETAPDPVIAVDRRRRVSLVNAAARTLLPDLAVDATLSADAVPGWLAEAHADESVTARGRLGGRAFAARGTPLSDEHVVWWLSDVSDQEAAERLLRSERERTAFLAQASSRLLSSLNLRKCVVATAELAAEHLADAAVVICPAQRRRLPVIRATADGAVAEEELLAVAADEMPGLAEALAGFPPVPSRWIDPAQAPAWLLPGGFGRLGSVVVTPLPGNGVPAGALVLLRRAGREEFSKGEETFARIFAARAGAAVSAATLYAEQTATAAVLQRELLPPPLRNPENVELAGSYRPSRSAQRVGGDFYDVHTDDGAGHGTDIVLGDVCGKGPEAAVLTGKIRNTLAALRLVESDHQRLLRLLNSALLKGRQSRFATLVLASVGGGGDVPVTLRLTSAGHPAPLIVRGDGHVETAATRGTLIGLLPEVTATTYATVLQPGETCLLYSDGVTEARGGPYGDTLFGEQRLADALGSCAGLPAEAVVERVQMLTSEWAAGREHGDQDDMALVAITVPHRTHLSAVGGLGRGRYTR